MKKSFLILFTLCAVFSCSKDNSFNIDKYPQKWTLVKMTGQIPNSERTGENMGWQEYYLLKSDGTFIKHRERDGINYDVSGNFKFLSTTSGTLLELTHDTENAIIGNCYSHQTEQLSLKSINKLVGTWQMCDGPGLEYERKE